MLSDPGAVGSDVGMGGRSERLDQLAVGGKGSIWQKVSC